MSFNDAYESLIDFDISNERKKKGGKKGTMKKDTKKNEETRKRARSPSPLSKAEPEKEEPINHDIPNRQYGDLYCKVCDSHMNSEQMWINHINGKRHIKASQKGDPVENKYEYCDDEPIIQKELDKETRPIAGLDHICEILRANNTPTYQCFLCSASITTSKLLIEHIMGLKHQMAFLKEHDKEKYALVESSALTKSYLEPIVVDLMQKYEDEHGRGKMSVKKERAKSGHSSYEKRIEIKGKQSGTKSAKSATKTSSSKTSRYSPPPKSSRYSPPPKSSRYSPPPSNSSRYSPPHSKSSRQYSPPRSFCYSPPPKSARLKERSSESEWKKVSPTRERSRERRYSDRSFYSDEENWKKIEPYYRRESDLDIDTRSDLITDYNSPAWPPVGSERNCSDLRVVLEQKKSLGMASTTTRADASQRQTSVPVSSEINTITENLLHLISDMSTEVFLQLTLFKMDDMPIENENQLKLLDVVANKFNTLLSEYKTKNKDSDLKMKFQETLAQNGILPQNNGLVDTHPQSNQDFTKNLDNLIGHYKARKATAYDDVHSTGVYSDPSNASDQYIDKKISYPQSNTSQYKSPPEGADSGWNPWTSTSIPFQSFSSTPASIPGLTLAEEPPAQPSTSTALSQFAQTAKNIFGNINVPSTSSNSYQNKDFNRLNYRY